MKHPLLIMMHVIPERQLGLKRFRLPQITQIAQIRKRIICENLRNLRLKTPTDNYDLFNETLYSLPQITQKIICENLRNLWLKKPASCYKKVMSTSVIICKY
jgi:hypothetical protein